MYSRKKKTRSFAWDREVVSVRLGRLASIEETDLFGDVKRDTNQMMIEDPFERRDLGRVFLPGKCNDFREKMFRTYSSMNYTVQVPETFFILPPPRELRVEHQRELLENERIEHLKIIDEQHQEMRRLENEKIMLFNELQVSIFRIDEMEKKMKSISTENETLSKENGDLQKMYQDLQREVRARKVQHKKISNISKKT